MPVLPGVQLREGHMDGIPMGRSPRDLRRNAHGNLFHSCKFKNQFCLLSTLPALGFFYSLFVFNYPLKSLGLISNPRTFRKMLDDTKFVCFFIIITKKNQVLFFINIIKQYELIAAAITETILHWSAYRIIKTFDQSIKSSFCIAYYL